MSKSTGKVDPTSAGLLKEARRRSGLSQRALAERAGTAQSVVARIEAGTASPRVTTLEHLLGAAGQELEIHLRDPHASAEALELRDRIRTFFGAQPDLGVVSVYLFGSTARGERHSESDLDIGLLLDRLHAQSAKARAQVRVTVGADLIAATGENDIDLVVLNDVPPGLARSIVLEGERLVCFDDETDFAFRRDVQLRAADLQPFLRRARRLKLAALAR
ncbi:MAG: helix-turn-helix domain-containing protein [Gemmatimonadota bacterium]